MKTYRQGDGIRQRWRATRTTPDEREEAEERAEEHGRRVNTAIEAEAVERASSERQRRLREQDRVREQAEDYGQGRG